MLPPICELSRSFSRTHPNRDFEIRSLNSDSVSSQRTPLSQKSAEWIVPARTDAIRRRTIGLLPVGAIGDKTALALGLRGSRPIPWTKHSPTTR